MKDLTVNRVAGAGLRANRRAYRGLAAGIFLSIFLVAFVCLAVHGAALSLRKGQEERLGAADAILFDCPVTDAELRDSGWFDTVARAGVTGSVAGGAKYLGWYDESAALLLRRRVLEGRLPQEPGELAAERSALEALECDAAPGDVIELEITPIDGAPETRSYTLVGVLPEQAALMDLSGSLYVYRDDGGRTVLQMPALIVSAEDRPFATGRVALHRVLTLRPGRSVRALMRSPDRVFTDGNQWYEDLLAGVARYQGELVDRWSEMDTPFFSPTVICALWLGASLLVAACVGVSGAMESRLAARLEEIGMLRAVGATRRQVRRIFGREAWLLAAATAPAALACACLAALLLARIAPGLFLFRPTAALLLPILAFSVLVILLSAHLPLRRAARTMPMQVLRDARLIRRMRGRASRGDFAPARLIALRQSFLHPGRLVGPALLVGLMVFMVFLAGTAAGNILPEERSAAFYMQGGAIWNGMYYSVVGEPVLSQGDIAQLRALPGVERVQASYSVDVNLQLDRLSDRFLEYVGYHDAAGAASVESEVLRMENGWPDDGVGWDVRSLAQEQWAVQQLLGTEKKLLRVGVEVVDSIPDSWREAVTEGRISRSALDAGEEVLVYAPDIYSFTDARGVAHSAPYRVDSRYRQSIPNDYFTAGQALAFTQLISRDRDAPLERGDAPQELLDFYAALERRDASARVGAILKGELSLWDMRFWDMRIITTEKGARALGLDLSLIYNVTIDLRGEPTPEQEEALERRVGGIAARGGMTVRNTMRSYRERLEENRMVFVTVAAASLVFFAAAVGLVSGGVRRRVAADTRAIGTLRAVGADERVLRRCYGGQVAVSLALGALIGAALVGALLLSGTLVPGRAWPLTLAAGAAFLGCAWAACAFLLRRGLNAVTRRPIIENIREL